MSNVETGKETVVDVFKNLCGQSAVSEIFLRRSTVYACHHVTK